MIEFLLDFEFRVAALFLASFLLFVSGVSDLFDSDLSVKLHSSVWFLLSSLAFAGGFLLCTQ